MITPPALIQGAPRLPLPFGLFSTFSIRGSNAEDHEDDRTAQQAKTIGEHACDGAGAIGNTERIAK